VSFVVYDLTLLWRDWSFQRPDLWTLRLFRWQISSAQGATG
jgi:hypothetical protein